MTATILRKRINMVLALLILGISFFAVYSVAAKGNKPGTQDIPGNLSLDQRSEQIGTWNCSGTTTFPYGTERPYYGLLQNEWTLDEQWLFMHFTEQQGLPPKPFTEHQYWGYTAATNKHTRVLMSNDGSFGMLTSDGWQGDLLVWQGTYTTGGMSYVYDETIERETAGRYHWYATIKQSDVEVGMIDLICNKT